MAAVRRRRRPSPTASPTRVTEPATTPTEPSTATPAPGAASSSASAPTASVPVGADGEPLADWEIALLEQGDNTAAAGASTTASTTPSTTDVVEQPGRTDDKSNDDRTTTTATATAPAGARAARATAIATTTATVAVAVRTATRPATPTATRGVARRPPKGARGTVVGGAGARDVAVRTARRARTPSCSRPNDLVSEVVDVVDVGGYLDIRDEGYGFLRVKGYLPSKEDAYIPLRLARQYGLRKGDHVTGKVRPAGRNEKNPGLLEVYTINGADPELAKRRPNFEDLTALFPDQRLTLEDPSDPTNMTARIIDLVSPIGKGQRGIIVSPPKAGKTTIMKTIAKSIELNNPEVILMVLLIDERPEEVTDMRRSVKGEVISSTFDRPSDEHTHVAEMAIAKARRLVEEGKDVVIMLDGITRLSRAYNLAAPASGKILSGGIDAGALYPPKRFFGAARNVEEGGSLTILATALVDTNSRMDEAIFEEFKGTGNMELRLDRKVAERRIYPAIDVDASSTRHEELLFDRKQLQQVWKLRRVLSGLAADGSAAAGLELLIDRLKTFRTNDEFLAEIAKQPSM